jgi:glutamate carboxypeptidase
MLPGAAIAVEGRTGASYTAAMDATTLLDLARERREDFVAALGTMVNVDCGSYTPDGVNAIADLCEERFGSNGWSVERRPHAPSGEEPRLGDLVIGRKSGAGGPNVLLVGHTDTVFDVGTVAERPFRIDGAKAYGPGVSDMKGGLLLGFFAVELLGATGFDRFGELTYVCNPDEEIGSPFSGPVIRDLAPGHDVALVLESARANGDVVSARKGITDLRIVITGKAAHAGVEPEKGRSAVLEAAHKIIDLQALNGRWPGVTVNVGVARGGTRTNVVPERCELQVDLRSPQAATLDAAMAEIGGLCERAVVPDVAIEVTANGWHRPMEKTEGGARLAQTAIDLARELGFDLHDAATGGASDANTTSSAGTPTLDGLGPIGGDDHAPGEWLDLDSVVSRLALLAGIVTRL